MWSANEILINKLIKSSEVEVVAGCFNMKSFLLSWFLEAEHPLALGDVIDRNLVHNISLPT
jgi:hypothetical protein